MPIIEYLVSEGNNVIVGADKAPLAFLKQEFPAIETVVIPGYEVNYSKNGSSIKLFCEAIRFYGFIKKENTFLNKILKERHIDLVISDNRYGLYSKSTKSTIITHQIFPKSPVGQGFFQKKILALLKNFDEVWVPDFESEKNLSGELSRSQKSQIPLKFIGPKSRFERLSVNSRKNFDLVFDVCAIISGPEPQRSIFEKAVLSQIEKYNLSAVVFRGMPENKKLNTLKNISVYNHAGSQKMYESIMKSRFVVCRSGYSSIMDMYILKKKTLLVATPNQTEQEYLANYHKSNDLFFVQKQTELDIKKAIDSLR